MTSSLSMSVMKKNSCRKCCCKSGLYELCANFSVQNAANYFAFQIITFLECTARVTADLILPTAPSAGPLPWQVPKNIHKVGISDSEINWNGPLDLYCPRLRNKLEWPFRLILPTTIVTKLYYH